MNVLICCEESQTVCKAFRELGHNAFSCDIQNCSGGFPEYHIKGDCLLYIEDIYGCGITFITEDGSMHFVKSWDIIIAHPPCTFFSKLGANLYSMGIHTDMQLQRAREFFMRFYNLRYVQPGIKICIENPVPIKRANLPLYSQTIQPYEFGDEFTKLTCLWLYNLPPLIPLCYGCTVGNSRNSAPSWVGVNRNQKMRSKTFNGIAKAMAKQWG